MKRTTVLCLFIMVHSFWNLLLVSGLPALGFGACMLASWLLLLETTWREEP